MVDEVLPPGMPLSGELKYSKQEPGGTMSGVNVDEIQHAMGEIDEASFRVYNDNLCPKLWDQYKHLDPRVRVNLLRMAYDFYDKTEFKAPILDIYLMGSVANYNWTPDSDADVHVIIDFRQLHMPPETAEKAAKTAGAAWNSEHKVSMMGHKVEINLQNVTESKPHVTGIYSLVKDQWVRQPSYQNPSVDKASIQTVYSQMKKFIDTAISGGDREAMKQAKKYLDSFRQYGLDTRGELSVENIVFKILRSRGLIKGLKDSITATYDKEMTVAEDMSKDELIRKSIPTLKDDSIRITVQRDDSFPESNYVQVDDGADKFSSNPEHMNKMGFQMPSSEEILGKIPQGRYTLADVRKALQKLNEVTQKDIKSRYPLPSALYKGDSKLSMMTLDNLKSMREKATRSWKFAQTHEDPEGVERAMSDFILFDTEMKKRMAYINAPVQEGYGAGIPEEDRLHIPGERWRIKSKDAPKTPKMPSESLNESVHMLIEELLNEKDTEIKSKFGPTTISLVGGGRTATASTGWGDVPSKKLRTFIIPQKIHPPRPLPLKKGTEDYEDSKTYTTVKMSKHDFQMKILNLIPAPFPKTMDYYVTNLKYWIKGHVRRPLKIYFMHLRSIVEKSSGQLQRNEDVNAKLLSESPVMKTLKKNKKPLTDEERQLVMSADATWHHGPNGEKTPAVWKSEVKGKMWYVCNTHRAMQVKPTIKGAIAAFKFIKTTA